MRIKDTKIYDWAKATANSNAFAKFIVVAIIWAVVSIPTDFYFLIRWIIGPVGFWQEFALVIGAVLVIGWIQGLLIFFGIILSLVVIVGE